MIKKGNQVEIISGKDKGKKGGIISKENFINISNLTFFEKSKSKSKSQLKQDKKWFLD